MRRVACREASSDVNYASRRGRLAEKVRQPCPNGKLPCTPGALGGSVVTCGLTSRFITRMIRFPLPPSRGAPEILVSTKSSRNSRDGRRFAMPVDAHRLAFILLPHLAIAGHCYQSTVPSYCCTIGCDSSYNPAGGCSAGQTTLSQIFSIAGSGGCSPLTEGSCSYGPGNLNQCTASGITPGVGSGGQAVQTHTHTQSR